MPTINEILNWNLSSSTFKNNADRIIYSKTKRVIKENIAEVNEIISKLPEGGTPPNSKQLKDIYFQFINYLKDGDIVFSRSDTRMLLWALDFTPEYDNESILYSDNFKEAIELIKNKWRDSFIITLWHLLLRNWNTLLKFPNQKKLLSKTLADKLGNYNLARKDIINLSNNINLFINDDSPYLYASELINSNYEIYEANRLINQKESILFYEFFSEVVFNYVELIENLSDVKLNSIYDFLKYQNSRRTKLLVCSSIINNGKYGRNEDIVKSKTLNIIGDPVKELLWRFNQLTESEREEVDKARKKLNVMLNRQFIKVFFEQIGVYEDRKKYWVNFLDKIDDIRFVGGRNVYNLMKMNRDISEYVNSRFRIISNISETTALLIYSRQYIFVEFSDHGPICIYREDTFNKKIGLKNVKNLKDLKWPTYYHASTRTYINEEGRINHYAGGLWQSYLNRWMLEYIE